VTNGTSTSNKIIHQALLTPGDIVLIDRDCHKSHHYGIVLAGAQPLYIDAFPLTQYSMYGSLAIRPIKEALLRLKLEGLVEIHPQRGSFVFQLGETEVAHLCQFRSMIECEALADAMKNGHAALVTALDARLDDMAAAFQRADHTAFPRLDNGVPRHASRALREQRVSPCGGADHGTTLPAASGE